VLIMMRYHLGSIALGSLIITIFSIIRMIIENTIEDNTFFAAIMECCLEMFEEILEYVTKKAYIMTGKPSYSSLYFQIFDYEYKMYSRCFVIMEILHLICYWVIQNDCG
jgi:hypothetical protein